MTDLNSLYSASAIVNDFHSHNSVPFSFFRLDRQANVATPISEYIQCYKSLNMDRKHHTKAAINELFTQDEVDELRHFLQRWSRTDIIVKEASLPIEPTSYPLGGLPYGGPVGLLIINGSQDNPLSFKVGATYDLRAGTPAISGDRERGLREEPFSMESFLMN